MSERIKVAMHPLYGYYRLDPLPGAEEFERFYRDEYYPLVAGGGRAPELRRLMRGGSEGEGESQWLEHTMWSDIDAVLRDRLIASPSRLLDVGCGPGHFMAFMRTCGWITEGVEPSSDAAERAAALGFQVFPSIEAARTQGSHTYDAVTLLNVLEHVFDPVALVQSVSSMIAPGGLLVIRVPNDFSVLQKCAQAELGKDPWWIAAPDHVNYFSFDSLDRLLEGNGFYVMEKIGDFPMELFLLFGEDYVGRPEVGERCHHKRVAFELAIPAELRRGLYRCFAAKGVGRNCLVFATSTGEAVPR